MPFALVILGLLMVISGARNTHVALGQQVVSDFTGPGNFTYWLIALGGVGSIGYFTPLKPVSQGFMVLILISFVLKNGGVFDKLNEALQQGPVQPAQAASAADSTGIKVVDHSTDYVSQVAQTAQTAIAAGVADRANARATASENFGKVASLAFKLFV